MNTFGTVFKVTLYGESHQRAIGVIVDGMPPGVLYQETLIQQDMLRRKPGAVGTTERIESDQVHVLSGIFNGYTTGSPIHLMIENQNTRSEDYAHLVSKPRPGHADFVSNIKYNGFQDYRGGGRFSGRLTAALVAGGALAKMALPFQFSHQLKQVGALKDLSNIDEYLKEIQQKKDSVGGIITVTVKDVPIGLGEPFFEKIESKIGAILFSIPAVKGVSFGVGFDGVSMLGSQFNDPIIDLDGHTKTNNSGGTSGGISNGNDLVVNVFVKPTSSIQKEQESLNIETNKVEKFEIGGRHDVAIVRRVGVVLENAVAIALADLYLIHLAYEHHKSKRR